ncbi:MAG: SGNH/GDSL hydrolase family protein [Verrucomicrobiales bacterium]
MKISSVFGLAALACLPLHADDEASLLRSGDRVALIGNTLIERARLYGHVEAALQVAAGPDAGHVTIRNLGWSGDSVFGDSRSYFGPPQEGRDRLDSVVSECQPSVAMLCYGTEAAMSVDRGWTEEKSAAERSAGGLEESLALFTEGYQDLVDRIRKAAGDSLREIVLISPPPLENLGDPLPDQVENNRNLAAFRDAIRDLAEKNGTRFVDLFAALGGDESDGAVADPPLTTNGLHYGEEGYRVLARELLEGLGYDKADETTFDRPEIEALRAAIVEKNRLFFHRWRPANETYLFLFRKHEQGQNAKEIPMFDPLVEKQDQRISAARKRVYDSNIKN